MAMEFLFCSEKDLNREQLQQGDILLRSDVLKEALLEAHQHYATAETYTHFAVITQTCDMVRRNGKKPNARYITVAAMRPAKIVIDRFLGALGYGEQKYSVPIYNAERRTLAAQFIERLINNTEPNFFFIPKGSHPSITEHMCIFLSLSVAMKVEHYDALLASKVAQLDDIFAAKLGWLVGNQYSRIATPDIEEKDPAGAREYKDRLIEEALDSALWIGNAQWSALQSEARKWEKENPETPLTPEQLQQLADNVPSPMAMLAERIVKQLKSNGIFGSDLDKVDKARNLIENDQRVLTIARQIQ